MIFTYVLLCLSTFSILAPYFSCQYCDNIFEAKIYLLSHYAGHQDLVDQEANIICLDRENAIYQYTLPNGLVFYKDKTIYRVNNPLTGIKPSHAKRPRTIALTGENNKKRKHKVSVKNSFCQKKPKNPLVCTESLETLVNITVRDIIENASLQNNMVQAKNHVAKPPVMINTPKTTPVPLDETPAVQDNLCVPELPEEQLQNSYYCDFYVLQQRVDWLSLITSL